MHHVVDDVSSTCDNVVVQWNGDVASTEHRSTMWWWVVDDKQGKCRGELRRYTVQ